MRGERIAGSQCDRFTNDENEKPMQKQRTSAGLTYRVDHGEREVCAGLQLRARVVAHGVEVAVIQQRLDGLGVQQAVVLWGRSDFHDRREVLRVLRLCETGVMRATCIARRTECA